MKVGVSQQTSTEVFLLRIFSIFTAMALYGNDVVNIK
jgi:hypothetical protein